MNIEIEIQEASGMAPSTVRADFPKASEESEKFRDHVSSNSPEKKHTVFNDPAFLTSRFRLLPLKLSQKLDLHRDDSLTTQLSTQKLQFTSQLTSPCMVPKPYEFQFNPNSYSDH